MNRPSRWERLWDAIWPPLPVYWRLDAAVIVVMIYTTILCVINRLFPFDAPNWGTAAAGLNAIILGLLLGFRNSQSYDRWWEGRKLWGQLVNDSRNLILKVQTLPGLTDTDRQAMRTIFGEFPVALREHLRQPGSPHKPMKLAGEAMTLVQAWREAGHINDFDRQFLDRHIAALMDICGACERIRGTPLPLSYRSLLRHGLVLLLLFTPLFIVQQSGWWSVLAMAILAYFLLGIELTAESIENPFEGDLDDLPLEQYSDTIRKSVLGESGVNASTPTD